MEQAFKGVGIDTAEQLRELGAVKAYQALLKGGSRPHFIAFYALEMALQGRPWNDCKSKEKEDLRKVFDALKSESFDDGASEFEKLMNQIGVIERS